MSLITIDESKCKKDGICAAECPIKIINVPDKTRFPSPVDNAGEMCINCGHCVAVCPHGALSHRAMKVEDCRELSDRLVISPEQGEQYLKGRRSARNYRPEPVGRETLERLIDMARYAPSGHNTQLVEWMVVYDREDVKKCAAMVVDWIRFMLVNQPELTAGFHMDLVVKAWEEGRDRITRDAPHLIIAHGPEQNPVTRDSCTIGATYLELAANALGLGACWAGYVKNAAVLWPPLRKELGFPEGNTAFAAMIVGHPKYKYHRIPLRNEPKVIWK